MAGSVMFSAERKLLEKKLRQNGAEGTLPQSNAEVLVAIDKLRHEMMDIARVLAPQHMPAISDLRDAVQQHKADAGAGSEEQEQVEVSLEIKASEISALKTELRAMTICIEQTKREISGFKAGAKDQDHREIASLELDAIVNSTESATETILSSVEYIEEVARGIGAIASNPHIDSMIEDISSTILKIFEACNFQDITGQRIAKVVATLQYIESRVHAMVCRWGEDEISNAPPLSSEVVSINDERSLLNGPQLNNSGISQDDIDMMFL